MRFCRGLVPGWARLDLFPGMRVQNLLLGLHERQDHILLMVRRCGQLFTRPAREPSRMPEQATAHGLRLALLAQALLAARATLLNDLLGVLDLVHVDGRQRVVIRATDLQASDLPGEPPP